MKRLSFLVNVYYMCKQIHGKNCKTVISLITYSTFVHVLRKIECAFSQKKDCTWNKYTPRIDTANASNESKSRKKKLFQKNGSDVNSIFIQK